jgi:hypothetical protein
MAMGLFRQNNPYPPKLELTYNTLALRMRDAQYVASPLTRSGFLA